MHGMKDACTQSLTTSLAAVSSAVSRCSQANKLSSKGCGSKAVLKGRRNRAAACTKTIFDYLAVVDNKTPVPLSGAIRAKQAFICSKCDICLLIYS